MAQLARRQHGVVSAGQLRGLGLTKNAVARRVQAGRLHTIHRGVYAVGHVSPSRKRAWMAAVLASGEAAVLSHRSAAVLWGLLAKDREIVDISVPGNSGKGQRKGIRLHRSRTLTSHLVTHRNGIPVTKPQRTIADLRRTAPAWEVRRAARQAAVLGLPMGKDVETDRTRSDLESDFLGLCRRHQLPEPEVNVRLDRFLVDFLWRDRHLIVETDGFKYHRGRTAFLDDRDRDLRLRALGFEVVRLSERQVNSEPEHLARVLGGLLG
jgi:very-short-patch-repair endonuclease